MRAARWHARRDVRVEEVPDPSPGPGEVLVKVELCGICGTDVEEYRDGPVHIPVDAPNPLTGRTAPLALGHEIVGTVDGTRVIPDVVLGCGACWWCRRRQEGICPDGAVIGLHCDGGLAGYVVAAADTCVPVNAPPEVAVFAEPTSVAVRACRKAGDLSGARVAILGGGTIGLLTAQVARAAGAGRITIVDPNPERRRLVASYGSAAVPGERVSGRGADVVVECSGAPGAVREAIRLVRRGGTVVLVGTRDDDEPLPLLEVVVAEKRLLGSAAHLWDEDVTAAVRLLESGVVDPRPLPSTRVPLDRVVPDGFEAEPGVKILVDPWA
ncbi:zinc-binding dehydrogenase [Actinoallomurus purpureus]|uniref:zinc-binding dehydrogenase n=1 Tax=Actinoallomurus purpureus TaxID=478114 RepID=UPI002092BFAC|nr:zinc-binding dehydrogenase [Actinoallomurus purpureus]MCO6004213.1 zinc-binding dehydrogenase [Actinoallomurus purpureus]